MDVRVRGTGLAGRVLLFARGMGARWPCWWMGVHVCCVSADYNVRRLLLSSACQLTRRVAVEGPVAYTRGRRVTGVTPCRDEVEG